jgi:hypothetical protein
MPPRITTLWSILIVVCLVNLIPPVAHAQTCPQPTIHVANPAVCSGAAGHAIVQAPLEWMEYTDVSWSIVNGTLPYGNSTASVTFIATGEGAVELTVTVIDTSACQATNSVTIPLATIPPPEINLNAPSACPGPSPDSAGGVASAAPPPEGVTYDSFAWSIANGAIISGQENASVAFTIDGTAPAVLTLTVRDSYGCESTNSTTIEIRTIPPPGINLLAPSACPGPSPDAGGGVAYAAPPPEGVMYDSFAWSIANGAIISGQQNASVAFTIDGTAPAVLTLTVRDSYGCESTNSTTVQIRTIPPPGIDLQAPSVCPGPSPDSGGGVAYAAPPPEGVTYDSFAWSITNGAIISGQQNASVAFTIDGTAPAVLTLTVRDIYGCVSTNNTTVEIRTIPPPGINLQAPSVCPGPSPDSSGGVAYAAPPPEGVMYDSFAWSITNGAIVSGQQNNNVAFTIDGTAPAVLTLTVRDISGCVSTNSTTVQVRTIPPPEISLAEPGICPGPLGNYASVPSPPEGPYQSFEWGIVNGTIASGQSNSSVFFTADGTGPVELTLTVRDSYGCIATSTVTVPLGTVIATIAASGPTTFCAGGSVTLTASNGASYLWSNGATTSSINVTSSGSYSVIVTNASGCSTTSKDTVVTVNTLPATPTITASGPTTFCPGGSVTLTAPAGFTYLWSTGATTRSITVTTTGNYSVTVSNGNGCSATSAATSVTRSPATAITVQPQSTTIPKNTSTTLSVTATGIGLSYNWYRGPSGTTFAPVGTNSSQFQTPTLNKGTHLYWVRVTGTCGVVNSVTATIVAN